MCHYLAGEVIVIRYQHIAGCQLLYSYILTGCIRRPVDFSIFCGHTHAYAHRRAAQNLPPPTPPPSPPHPTLSSSTNVGPGEHAPGIPAAHHGHRLLRLGHLAHVPRCLEQAATRPARQRRPSFIRAAKHGGPHCGGSESELF